MIRRDTVFLFFLLFASCKSRGRFEKHHDSIPSAAALELAQTLPDSVSCKKSDGTLLDALPFSVDFENTELYSEEAKLQFLKTVQQSLSTVPFEILTSFTKINGKIILVEDIEKYCPVPEEDSGNYPSGTASCWIQGDQGDTVLYISLLDANHQPTLVNLSQNTLIAFGQIFEKVFLNQMVYGQEELFPLGLKNSEGIEAYRFDLLQEFLSKIDSDYPIPYDMELSNFLMSRGFFAYYCNANTKETLQEIFPQTYATIKTLTDNYKPKDFISGDGKTEGLGLFSLKRFEESAVSATKKVVEHPTSLFRSQKPFKTQILVPKTSNDAEFVLKKQTVSYNEAHKGLDSSKNIMGGMYYNGTPRLVRSVPGRVGDPVTIMIHGTYSADSVTAADVFNSWCNIGSGQSNVPKILNEGFGGGSSGEVMAFQWSGRLDGIDRRIAGEELAKVIASLHAMGRKVNLVGYSHGGNIATVALNRLRNVKDASGNPVRIQNFISLGRPVMRSKDYKFDLSQISGRYLFVKGQIDFVPGITGNRTVERSAIKEKETGKVVYTKVKFVGLKSYHADLVSEASFQHLMAQVNETYIVNKVYINLTDPLTPRSQ